MTDTDTDTEWAVTLQLVTDVDDVEAAAGDLLDLLEDSAPDRGSAVSASDESIEVTLTAVAVGWREALAAAFADVFAACAKLGVDAPVVVEAHVRTYDVLEREALAAALPQLAGTAEVAALLRVSKTRVGELERTLPDRFPQPLIRLAAGPVWSAAAVELFAQSWERKPGRRPK